MWSCLSHYPSRRPLGHIGARSTLLRPRDTTTPGVAIGATPDSTLTPDQSGEADAEGLAAGDSLGVSDPGGSQSALMAL